MSSRLALSHHQHTGKVLPTHHTSYLPLLIVLAIVGVLLGFYTSYASSGPGYGSIGVTGIMPARPPKVGATITSPTNGQHFTVSPVTVEGTCPDGLLVEVYKNDIFGGSTFCNGGKFSLQLDMLYGKNTLVARVYDALNQSGPDSNIVTIYYDFAAASAPGTTSLDFGGAQLLLNTDAVYRGIFPNHEMAFPLTVLGGKSPYAISINWGDSTTSLVPRGDNTTFTTPHIYKKPGVYYISVKATDASGRVAFITVVAIVNGQPDPYVATNTTKPAGPDFLIALWPLYVSMVAIVVSFWLGERREKHVLEKHGQLIQIV